jgi:hypothetical protein
MKITRLIALATLLAFTFFTVGAFPGFAQPALAREGQVLGIHILHPYELDDAEKLVKPTAESTEQWSYVTIPLTLEDLDKKDEWQNFFNAAKEKKIIPLVRLTTRFENGSWAVPDRKDVTDQIKFLSKLEWPTDKKHIIVFNEVNHAKEWGGSISPEEYVDILHFTANWAHSEGKNYVVMPAAMDLAAPNGSATMEAFTYLDKMLTADAEAFHKIDVWNSHSYPNPGFSASPEGSAKNTLRGFTHELTYIREKTGRDLQVFITETGWVKNSQTIRWLERYYTYALENIWSDPRVLGVTPFVLRGDPGPFSGFAFLDRNNKPTPHYVALQNALKKVQPGSPRNSGE